MESKDLFMLCQSIQDREELKALDRSRYKANIKFDGCRCMAIKNGKDIILFGRGGNIYNNKFNEVVKALSLIPNDFIIDGEIIDYTNNFNLLSKRALTKDKTKIAQLELEIPVKYMIFDILKLDNCSVINYTLAERTILLRNLFDSISDKSLELVKYGEIDELLSLAIKNNGEGIVIKNMFGLYESKRSKNWLKHKLFLETEITITDFTENNAGIRATDNEGNAVQIAGHHSDEVKAVMESKGYATILVQYLEKTKENKLRFISYRGLK